jgi:hypothetical protein
MIRASTARIAVVALAALAAGACHVFAFGDIPCSEDAQCPSGLECRAGTCEREDDDGDEGEGEGDEGEGEGDEGEGEGEPVPECSESDPCPGGGACSRGRCYDACEDDGDCDPAFACIDAFACLPRCNDQDDCDADEVCVDFGLLFETKTACLLGCRDANDPDCAADEVCTFNFTCEPPAGNGALFAPCHSVEECDGALECLQDFAGNNYCTTRCDDFADPPIGCTGGLTCEFNTCTERCVDCTFDCCPITGFTCDAETDDCVP